MMEIDARLFALLAEGFALVTAMLLISLFAGARRRRRERKALRALVAEVNTEAAARREQARAAFGDAEQADGLCKQERALCQAIIRAFHKRDSDLLSGVYAHLKSLVDAYQQARGASDAAEDAAAQAEAVARLKQDHEQVSRELDITKRTMEKMLREYNSMFAGGATADEADIEADADAGADPGAEPAAGGTDAASGVAVEADAADSEAAEILRQLEADTADGVGGAPSANAAATADA